jgi:hypothetical protein
MGFRVALSKSFVMESRSDFSRANDLIFSGFGPTEVGPTRKN